MRILIIDISSMDENEIIINDRFSAAVDPSAGSA